MHCVQAFVASPTNLDAAKRRIPALPVILPPHGFALSPLTDEVIRALQRAARVDAAEALLTHDAIASAVSELGRMCSVSGMAVYVATEYFGGRGSQEAQVWEAGTMTMSMCDSEQAPAQWPNSPISRALRHLGVTAVDGCDEFDTLGLGRWRSTGAWATAAQAPKVSKHPDWSHL